MGLGRHPDCLTTVYKNVWDLKSNSFRTCLHRTLVSSCLWKRAPSLLHADIERMMKPNVDPLQQPRVEGLSGWRHPTEPYWNGSGIRPDCLTTVCKNVRYPKSNIFKTCLHRTLVSWLWKRRLPFCTPTLREWWNPMWILCSNPESKVCYFSHDHCPMILRHSTNS